MKRSMRSLILLVGLMVVLLSAGPAQARFRTTDQLTEAGWTCLPAGPSNWTHCFSEADTEAASLRARAYESTGGASIESNSHRAQFRPQN